MTTRYMQTLLAGARPDADAWAEHLEHFHRSFPDVTSRAMTAFRTRDGETSYRLLAREIASQKPASVFDIGYGGGELLSEISHALPGVALFGADRSIDETRRAKKRVRSGTLVTADIADWKFERGYDAICAHLVLSLLPDVGGLFTRLREALTPGGRFYAMVEAEPPSADFAALVGAAVGAVRADVPDFVPRIPQREEISRNYGVLLEAQGFTTSRRRISLAAGMSISDAVAIVERIYFFGLLDDGLRDAVRSAVAEAARARSRAGRVRVEIELDLFSAVA